MEAQPYSSPPKGQTKDLSGYLSDATIGAFITAIGGTVSVLRVSGKRAEEFLKAVNGNRTQEHGKLQRVDLNWKGVMIDEAMACLFLAPHSFTGETCAEFHCHGGEFVAASLWSACEEFGIRQALPGEFSFRAVQNGKMTIAQAEAIADLIQTASEDGKKLALERLSGSANFGMASKIREELVNLSTLSELGIDFSDQDIDEVSLGKLKKSAHMIVLELERLKETYARGRIIQEGLRVAIIGPPNAGKSSLFNQLVGESRAIVSSTPGTTRDVIREEIRLTTENGLITLKVSDTAGVRSTADEIENLGIERTKAEQSRADLTVWVIDATEIENVPGYFDNYRKIFSLDSGPKGNGLILLNKADLVKNSQAQVFKDVAKLGIGTVLVSCVSANGFSAALAEIKALAQKMTSRKPNEFLLTRADQIHAIKAGIEDLKRAIQAPEPELFSADIRQALNRLAPIIGQTPTEEILGQIFSRFCIGK